MSLEFRPSAFFVFDKKDTNDSTNNSTKNSTSVFAKYKYTKIILVHKNTSTFFPKLEKSNFRISPEIIPSHNFLENKKTNLVLFQPTAKFDNNYRNLTNITFIPP